MSVLSEGNLIPASSPGELFESLRAYTATRFFSRNTIFNPTPPTAAREDDDYFYDGENRKIAHKGAWYRLFGRDPEDAEIDPVIAREQFDEVAPVIVRHVASLIRLYFDTANPLLPGPADFFDFAVTRLEILSGSIDFVDDFADGRLDHPPTSRLFSFSPVEESDGSLRLRSVDGANRLTPGFLVDNVILGQ
ncbi:MAG: hypothetical protein G01um1014106_378, partial [Parcubacteria group bacterium Gr01-1014_106]